MSSHDQQAGSSKAPAPSVSAGDHQHSGNKPPSLPKLYRMSISEQNPDPLAGSDMDQTKRRRVQDVRSPATTATAAVQPKYPQQQQPYPKHKHIQPFTPTGHIPLPDMPHMLPNMMFNAQYMFPQAYLGNPAYMQQCLSSPASPQRPYKVSPQPQAQQQQQLWNVRNSESSSDADVIVDEEMTNKNICFGMLQTEIVTIRSLNLVKDEQYEPVTVTSEGRRDNVNYCNTNKESVEIPDPDAKLLFLWIAFTVKSRAATPKFLGWVPFDDTKLLGPLAERHLIWWDAFIPRSKATPSRTPLYMILYCQPTNIQIVAKTFQQQEKLLHTPPFFNPSCRYQNLNLSRLRGAERSSTPSSATSSSSSVGGRPRLTMQQSETHIRQEIGRLLESIRHDSSQKNQNSASQEQQELEDQDLYIPGLNVTLLPHQVQGIRWMLERESNNNSAGGILADMGLGKTIQTIGLIASTMQTSEAKRRTTLVVTPLALVRQWAREIAAKTDPGTINVLIYHGPNRAKDASKFFDYDVVITTYQVVASDLPNKESSKDRTKLEDILKSDTSSVCTEEEIDTASSSTQQTRGPLLQFDWYRVVLDEAQYIKNRATRSAISCTELSAQKRWCLTGTPMQNNVDELYSLFRFLRIKPLSEYHTFKDTISIPMQSGRVDTALERLKVVLMAVMLRRTKQIFKVDGDSCNTSSSSSTSSGVSEAESTSDNCPSVSTQLAVKLPPRDKTDIVLTFSPEERRLYDLLSTRMRRTVKEILQAGKGTRNYMNMLCMILRLRQACDHPQLVLSILKDSDDAIALATEGNGAGIKKPSSSSSTDAASQRVLVEKLASDLGWQGAGMLGQSVFDKASSDSNVICDLCGRVIPFADSIGSFCAMCKEQINQYAAYSLVKQDSRLTSTKVSKTLEILQDIQRESPGEKTVIFSQFTSMLDLMQEPLRQSGIKFCRYDGSMPNYLREKSLVTLQKDPECTVMLISLKCGSLGLNLTAANRVILLDIWWNPAVEEQAIDRVHRIGQTLPVRVVRLMIDNTIEEKIVKLQQKKAQMVHGVLGDGIVRNTKLTMEEIRALFDL